MTEGTVRSTTVDLGAAARVVRAQGNGHRHSEESVYEAMLEGWAAEQRRQGLSAATVRARLRVVRRFVESCNHYPWRWNCRDLEEWAVSLLARPDPVAFSTVRSYQQIVAAFCGYLADDRRGWAPLCEDCFGTPAPQICHQWNNLADTREYGSRPGNRPLTRGEVQSFFDHADGQVAEAERLGPKRSLAAMRDAALFKVVYAWGLRTHEAVRVDVDHFGPSRTTPELGRFAVLSVPSGQSSNGGPPSGREVCTVMPWAADVVADYVADVRPRYGCDSHPALWLTERGGRISSSHVNERFGAYRDALGLPKELGPQCLRQSYVTHLMEDGFDELFVQRQVGHGWGSTAALYTGVSTYFKSRVRRVSVMWGPASAAYIP